jgi:hypothetical protein
MVFVVDHVHVEAALHADHRRDEADRAGAGNQQRPRLPGARTLTDALGVIPRLGDDARRLQQHGSDAERDIDLDQESGSTRKNSAP